MKTKILSAILILLSICLVGCTGDLFRNGIEAPLENPIEGPIGGNFHADPIYGVFYDAETDKKSTVIIGQHNYYDDTTAQELTDALSSFTGLILPSV